jgi:TM2 domain-containing membrane protein YozV
MIIAISSSASPRSLGGIFGAHRFYVGKVKSVKVQLYTLGGLGIWMLIGLILIVFGEFLEEEGKKIRDWV